MTYEPGRRVYLFGTGVAGPAASRQTQLLMKTHTKHMNVTII